MCIDSLTQNYSCRRNPEQQTIQWRISSLSHRSENGGESPSVPLLNLIIHGRDPSICVRIPQASVPFWAGSRWQKAPGDRPSSQSSSQARAAHSRAVTSSWSGAAIGCRWSRRDLLQVSLSITGCVLAVFDGVRALTFHLASQGNIWRTISEPVWDRNQKNRWLLSTVKIEDPRCIQHHIQ